MKNTCVSARKSEWVCKFEALALQAEKDELINASQSQKERLLTGSFYTPLDVANFICNRLLDDYNVNDLESAHKFLKTHTIVEPSCGAGIFIFALFKCLFERGLEEGSLKNADFVVIDINQMGLLYLQKNILEIGLEISVTAYCEDFRDFDFCNFSRPVIFFGNPPFIKKDANGKYDNLYADFIDKSIRCPRSFQSVYYIVPLSICFSNAFKEIRSLMRSHKAEITIFNYDNIPDCLFNFGKPGSENTNKANSQRCSIICINRDKKPAIYASRLISWKKHEREQILRETPKLYDITSVPWKTQFMRPYNQNIIDYMNKPHDGKLSTLLLRDGQFNIALAPVARNFIGLREVGSCANVNYAMSNFDDLIKSIGVLNSRTFFTYWKSVSDGFHLTKGVIEAFPISKHLSEEIFSKRDDIAKVWQERTQYAKVRHIGNKKISTYDLSTSIQNIINL